MNPNELVNELLDMDSYEFAFNEVRAAVLTLLTQQAEIERLTQENCDLWEQLNDGKAKGE